MCLYPRAQTVHEGISDLQRASKACTKALLPLSCARTCLSAAAACQGNLGKRDFPAMGERGSRCATSVTGAGVTLGLSKSILSLSFPAVCLW